jgi:hypothetical protein
MLWAVGAMLFVTEMNYCEPGGTELGARGRSYLKCVNGPRKLQQLCSVRLLQSRAHRPAQCQHCRLQTALFCQRSRQKATEVVLNTIKCTSHMFRYISQVHRQTLCRADSRQHTAHINSRIVAVSNTLILKRKIIINHLTPNVHFSGRTALLTYRCCIFFIYSTNIRTEYLKHAAHSPFFPLQNAVYFIMLRFLVHVLFTVYIQDVLKF